MLNGEDGVADGQGGDGGHHRLVLKVPELRQHNVNRQSGDQEYGRDDADDADQRVLPRRRHTRVHQVLVETRQGDLAAVPRRLGHAKSEGTDCV